ncbi:MAG: hypothetical protein D6766_08295, partial [Verrucomicrobia bacterium]
PGEDFTKLFRFTPTNAPPAIEFSLDNATGPARLLVRYGAQPDALNYDFADLAAPGAPARLLIRTNANLPDLSGEWYVAVLDLDTVPITYTLTAATVDPTPQVIDLTPGIPVVRTVPAEQIAPDLPARPDYFRLVVDPLMVEATFTLTPVNGNADLILRKGLPLPTPALFDYFSLQPGTTPDVIVVSTNSQPVPLSPGDWYVGVLNQTANSVTYSLLVEVRTGDEEPPLALNPVVVVSGSEVRLSWSAPPGLRFRIEYATELPPDGNVNWIPVPGEITSADGQYEFVDDGSQTGGMTAVKFYRIVPVP